MSKTGEDCYFFIHGSCRNGDSCLFRHCRDSLLTQDSCKEWIAGKCIVLLCPKRHPQISNTPVCKFENSPTGCLNRNCTYRHLKSRETAKLPVALAEALKKSVSLPQTNGDKPRQTIRRYITAPSEMPENILEIKQTPEQTISYLEPELKPIQNKSTIKLKLKPITTIVEKPAPIPIISLRSGAQIDTPSYNTNSSAALMCNLKVLTTHTDTHTSERHIATQKRATSQPKSARNAPNLKSPPSPITFEDRPRKLSPITFRSGSKNIDSQTTVRVSPNLATKRTRLSLRKETNTESPKDETPKPSMKRLRIRKDSSLADSRSPEEGEDQVMVSPLLSPLDSTAYFGNSVSCSFSESINGSQSDDIRIEDQIEDLINANFSPKETEEQIDLDDMQDSDDIFLQFEDLIS